MKESSKGVLLSALIYPGAGQLALGSIFTGTMFILLTTAGLSFIIYRMTKRIVYSFDQILSMPAGDSVGLSGFMELISSGPYESWRIEMICTIVVFFCWTVSIVHAYWFGQKIDRR